MSNTKGSVSGAVMNCLKDVQNVASATGDKFSGYKCKECGYTTAQRWILDRHVSAVHSKRRSCVQRLKGPFKWYRILQKRWKWQDNSLYL